ncbi:hypothetical protein AAG906_000917 [Vitis piasezkii]
MTTNIAESFNACLREERHQTIYTLLLMHMDKLIAMLNTHMRGTNKWKSAVGPKTEEKLMSNIMRFAPITMMPYLGGTFKVFTGEVYLVMDMQQHKCTCLTWKMSRLPFIILTMAGNGLDGSATNSLPISVWFIMFAYLCPSMFTRCSTARFKKICNRLPEEKIQAIRDLQFGGLLNLNCTGAPQHLRIEFSAQKHYPVTATDVGLIFGLPTEGRILQVTSTSSEHPFGTIRACEEKLLNLPVGEEFRRAFIFYACATLLAPTSRLNGCHNLWHTIHEDGFEIDVNWAQFVLDQLVEGIRRYQQSNTSWCPALAWTDDLIKRRLVTEIKEFGAFGHVEVDFASQRSPIVKRTMEAEPNVDHDTNVDAKNSDQLRIMCGLMHKLGARRHSGVNSDVGGHFGYAPANTPRVDNHAFPGDEDMASHAVDHVIDTLDRVVAPEFELQPSVPINAVRDGEEQPEGNVVPTNRNVRRRRVRRMAPNLLSPYISQPQTKQSAIRMDLKQATTLVFLLVLIKNHWTMYVYDLSNKRIQLLDSRPGMKKTTLSGIQQNLAKVVLWLAAHKKEVSPYDLRTFNFLTPDVPLQPNDFCNEIHGVVVNGLVLQINRCGMKRLDVRNYSLWLYASC